MNEPSADSRMERGQGEARDADARYLPDPGDSIIRLIEIVKAFGAGPVLDRVSLDIERGCTTVIIGPSGIGKSVLLKHIVGLIKPDRGEVWFDGQRIDQFSEARLAKVRMKIGFLFQLGALFDSMNVRENICLPLVEHTHLSTQQGTERCRMVLDLVGLSGLEQMMPSALSGGQRKRVALARAIVLEPEVVLYDEPTTGLDPIRADVINHLIIALSGRLGITSVVVTHDMSSAERIADRIVMLYDGGIIADGDPQAFVRVDNELVQRFIKGQADQEELDRIRGMIERPS